MKRILKTKLDKFYTKREVSKELIEKIDLQSFDFIIEPSCGDGSFFDQINHPNKIGVDIEPEIDGVITHDFLTLKTKIKNDNVLVIGNPPFGKQGSLALKFIKKSSEYAKTIAFILPISFMKESMKNRIPEFYHLSHEEILNENSFLLDGENFPVRCCFQIWEKKDFKREKSKKIEPKIFSYTTNKSIADIAVRRVGVYAGKAFLDTNKSPQSHYFLIFNDKTKIDFYISALNNNNSWSNLTVGPKSISKNELNAFLNDF